MTKTKKTKSAGRFGARYGSTVKHRLVEVEIYQRKKQKSPFCSRLGVKREAAGIWHCPKCEKRFAGPAYVLNAK